MDKLLLLLEHALNITVTTNTLVLSIKDIKNWQQLLIRLQSNNVPRYLVHNTSKWRQWNIFTTVKILFEFISYSFEYEHFKMHVFFGRTLGSRASHLKRKGT